ncbi:hypothetical protein GF339_12240 [candidate division KSB3 bacterium]|uniref:Uncharacterized protein n=1 Tax=candidate division KSB3 bacterium TaxID=2044937 RepID=A0A9D5Q652_9BACT|nr:hypothetical protein [candidate division KSB3 bacterium]MBD3325350.1 hypothetical protein [candidate division KSB3 bacterium]
MVKKLLPGVMVWFVVLTLVVEMPLADQVNAQETRSIVPYPRDEIRIETIDPRTQMPKQAFCIGVNTIDVKLTNTSGYRQYVSVINRDTRGTERTLYSGWLEPGVQFLSALLRKQLELTGPAGTEMLRVERNQYGQGTPGTWVSFYVQDCGGGFPPGGGYGYAQLRAWIQPYAIEQGKKGTITLQTSVGSRPDRPYYFEILNSWGQLWKRLPVSKRPHEHYQVTLPVGTSTKPGMLTYTVNLWLEGGVTEERTKVASTQFSFRVITAGSTPTPYGPGYPTYPTYPGWSPSPYDADPYSGMPPYSGTTPYPSIPSYGMSPYTMSLYGTYYPGGPATERQIQ